MVGGSGDNSNTGAAWIFATSDFPTLSIVVTKPATTVTTNSAFLNGTADGNGNLTTVVFEYSTSPDLSNSTILNIGTGITTVSGDSGVNNLTNILTGLSPGTIYYFRIVGTTTIGQSVGENLSFTTSGTKPTGGTTDFKIPTAFTPNNDGINDKWDLAVLDDYPNCIVKVFNRYGQVVYSCNGIYKAWDGRSGSKDMPQGTYYYTIKFDPTTSPISGSLLLIR
jgi:gliding motility-associated-like protein